MSTPVATILGSEVRTLKSTHTGREYRITVSLPYAHARPWDRYFPADFSRPQWPVVYLLDANWFFGMVTDMARSMAWCGRTTDAIIVGIGYPENDDPQEAWFDANARRDQDFHPLRDEKIEKETKESFGRDSSTGDGENFHQFIRNELIPFIEANYHADASRRILVGHSSAGLFGTYALLREPELFDSYILVSPWLVATDGFIFQQEKAYSEQHKQLKARVHLSAGELEESVFYPTLSNMIRFATLLESRNYEGFSMVRQSFANMNHCEVVAPAIHAGLLWALRK